MGGKALGKLSHRLSKPEYQALWVELQPELTKLFGTVFLVPSYHSKTDFGDMDILVQGAKPKDVPALLRAHFHTPEVVVNSEVVSFAMHDFQVDLIFAPENLLTSYLYFYGYNDLGMLLGRVARGIGLKYGQLGLHYVYHKGNDHAEIVLSQDVDCIYRFLGLDKTVHDGGFDTLHDVYRFAVSSCWFQAEAFLQHDNAVERRREKNRPSYSQFKQWLLEVKPPSRDVSLVSQAIHHFFPHFAAEYARVEEDFARKASIKAKFNGRVVSEVTGLKDQALGLFMDKFKLQHPDFASYILSSSQEDIRQDIARAWREQNNL